MAKIETKLFGFTRSGDPVNEYILSNPGGLSVSVLDYGAIIKNIIVPARRGPVDVVLGHDTIQEYELDTATYCGSFVGRYANRIEGAAFTLNGKTYQLEANNGRNHLHGCFARKSYAVKAFGDTLLLEADSPDGEEGFPGNMKIAVRYTLTPDNAFRMDYRVSSDADTIVNLTNHTYFNLNGGGTVLNQRLKLFLSGEQRGDLPHRPHPAGGGHPDGLYQGQGHRPGHRPRLRADPHGRRRVRPLLHHRPPAGRRTAEHLRLGHLRREQHQHEGLHHPAGRSPVHRQLFAGLPQPRQGAAPHAEIRRLLSGDRALPLLALPPRVPLHHPAGGQGVPGVQHPAVFHRQAVRRDLKGQKVSFYSA